MPTCTDTLALQYAYNVNDAQKFEELRIKAEKANIGSLLDSVVKSKNVYAIDEFRSRLDHVVHSSEHLKYLQEGFQYHLIMPTPSSLSGIGAIYFHKNLLGRISIACSLGLSLLSLLIWTFFERRRINAQILFLNMVFLSVFIVDSILTNVTVLYGGWSLMFLLMIQWVISKIPNRAITLAN